MPMVLVAILAVDAILHGLIVMRFGVKGNEPPLVFGLGYLALAVAAFYGVAGVLWAVLIVSVVGTIGLAVSLKRIAHETTIERVILGLNGVIILFAAYLLFL